MRSTVLKIARILLPVLFVLFSSCSSIEMGENHQSVNSKYVPTPIVIPTKNLDWDVSYHPKEGLAQIRSNNQSYEIAVTTPNLYIGAVYGANSVNELRFAPIPNAVKAIDITYTFPRYYFDLIQRPSLSSMNKSLQKAIESPKFSGKQSLSFEYDYREFSSYSELKLAFGANVNIGAIFKLGASVENQKIKSKTGLFARVVQKNFSVVMDYPTNGNIFQNEGDLNKLLGREPVYINSITYGRMGIIAIESDYSYSELKSAFQASLTAGKVGVGLNLTDAQKKILSESTIKIFVSGGAGHSVAQIVTGFDKFTEFILSGGEFTKDVPGVPIFFTANYARDNSVFSTSFKTN